MNTLQDYGWTEGMASDWNNRQLTGCVPARVTADFGRQYKVATPELAMAHIPGSATHKLKVTDMPKVGDWVAIEVNADKTAVIRSVLPRRSEIVRGVAGRTGGMQVVAANVDMALIVQPLDHGFSVARLERFLFQLAIQNIEAVILLNKADQAKNIEEKQSQIQNLGAKFVTMSALSDNDIQKVAQMIKPGKTAVILGQSGAGKSTIINRLVGRDVQATAPVREIDSRGRHTTVHREMFTLPGGGLIIDTPGIRELKLWGNVTDLNLSFPEIAETAARCHYNNCSHTGEKRCAVRAALADGVIDKKRYAIYLNFKNELQLLQEKSNFIADRRAQWSRESIKRRRNRIIRADIDRDFDD